MLNEGTLGKGGVLKIRWYLKLRDGFIDMKLYMCIS